MTAEPLPPKGIHVIGLDRTCYHEVAPRPPGMHGHPSRHSTATQYGALYLALRSCSVTQDCFFTKQPGEKGLLGGLHKSFRTIQSPLSMTRAAPGIVHRCAGGGWGAHVRRVARPHIRNVKRHNRLTGRGRTARVLAKEGLATPSYHAPAMGKRCPSACCSFVSVALGSSASIKPPRGRVHLVRRAGTSAAPGQRVRAPGQRVCQRDDRRSDTRTTDVSVRAGRWPAAPAGRTRAPTASISDVLMRH